MDAMKLEWHLMDPNRETCMTAQVAGFVLYAWPLGAWEVQRVEEDGRRVTVAHHDRTDRNISSAQQCAEAAMTTLMQVYEALADDDWDWEEPDGD